MLHCITSVYQFSTTGLSNPLIQLCQKHNLCISLGGASNSVLFPVIKFVLLYNCPLSEVYYRPLHT